MATRPGIPGLRTHGLPALKEDEAAATASPARGSEMKIDFLKKLRNYEFVHIWDCWHARPADANSRDPTYPLAKYQSNVVLKKMSDEEGIGSFDPFWRVINNFPISTLKDKQSLFMFHHGVRPEWEDPRNARGGSWSFAVKDDIAAQIWHQLNAMAGSEGLQSAVATNRESFNDEICGISCTVRVPLLVKVLKPGESPPRIFKFSIWNRDGDNTAGKEKLMKYILEELPDDLTQGWIKQPHYQKHSEKPGFTAVSKESRAG